MDAENSDTLCRSNKGLFGCGVSPHENVSTVGKVDSKLNPQILEHKVPAAAQNLPDRTRN